MAQAHESWDKPWKRWPGQRYADAPPPSAEERERIKAREAQERDRAREARARDPRPNILFVFSDQQMAQALSCAGNRWVNTPHMDRLADEGVRFAQCYCVAPVSGPSRAALMTGRLPHENGVVFNGESPRPELPNFGQTFRAAGYATVYSGKWHLPNSYPQGDDAIPGFDQINRPKDPRNKHGLGDVNDFGFAFDADFFLRYAAPQIGIPWLYTVSLHNPHDICQFAMRKPRRLRNMDRYPPLPGNFEIDPEEVDFLRIGRESKSTHIEMAPSRPWDGTQWRAYIQAYYRLVEQVDRALGYILDALDESGQAENTLVVFASDHGEGCGAHRWPCKLALYEECARVPLILRYPGRIPAGRVDDTSLTSLLDLYPTFCDYAGFAPPPVRGKSLKPAIDDPRAAWRDFVPAQIAAYRGDEHQRHGRMLRTARYKYNAYDIGARREELYDLADDPGETRNLARDGAHASVLTEHRARLRAWLAETDDGFAVPE